MSAGLKTKPTAAKYAQLGNWYADQKQFECAAEAFGSASGLDPQSASLAYLWGLSLHSAGFDDKSLIHLRRAVQIDPSDIRPHLVLAAALDRLKKPEEAESEWLAARAIDPDSPVALDGLSSNLIDRKDYPAVIALLDQPAGDRMSSPQQSLNLGMAFVGAAKLDDAAKVLREGLNTTPDSLPIADELAIVLMLLSREEEADTVFDLALQKHPGDQATQLLYLRTLVSSNSAKAKGMGQELLASYPNQWEVLYLNAVLASREGNFPQARAYLDHSISLHPEYAPAHTQLGNALAKLNDLPGAKRHLEKAIALGENSPEVHYDLARVLQALGETEAAHDQLRTYQQIKSAQMGKTQAAGKAEMGDQAMANGQAEEAASLYREALKSDPDEALLYYKLSKALEKAADIAGETTALKQAIQLDPNLPEAQNQMGYLSAKSGDSAKAESFFSAAVRASPSYVVAWVNLAAALASEGKWDDAKQALDRALKIDPDNAQARRLDQAIADARPKP